MTIAASEGIPHDIMASVEGFFSRTAETAARDISEMFIHLGEAQPTVVSNLLHLAKAIEASGGTLLIQMAQHAAAAAEAVDGAPDKKFAAARDAVAAALTSRGIPVVWNAVNGAIEAAVAAINASAAATPAAGPTATAQEAAAAAAGAAPQTSQ